MRTPSSAEAVKLPTASSDALGVSCACPSGRCENPENARGAIGLLVIYSLIFEGRWAEWWQFFIAFLFAAVGCIIYANMLTRDADAGREDPAVIKLGRILVMALLVGMVIAIASLFIDGKFPRDVSHPDWAACNIFFFGALAVAAICINALLSSKA